MTRHSCITNSTVDPATSPTIVRSTVDQCAFNNLNPADTIQRSVLSGVTITSRAANADNNTANTPFHSTTVITRSKISNSALSNVSTRRSDISNSRVENVASARSLTVKDSHLEDIRSANRCSIKNSVVSGNSVLKRSEVHDSTVNEQSSVRRSRVSRSRVAHSRVKRSALTDCDVANCILIRTDFKGVVLRNGVWKNGRLIGRMGHTEVVAVGGDEKVYLLCLFELGTRICTDSGIGFEEYQHGQDCYEGSAGVDEGGC